MATAAILRDQLVRAQNYLAKQAQPENGKPFDRDLRLESLARVLQGEIPLRLHAHRADDIMTAIRIADEFGFRLTIEHATEAYKVADELSRRDIPVMVGPLMTARTKVELRDRTTRTPGMLAQAGVKVAIVTDHWVVPVNLLMLSVIVAVRDGMCPDEALRAVTINPAEIMGVGARLGSLTPGKDADLQILSGPPLEALSRVEQVYVNGAKVYEYTA